MEAGRELDALVAEEVMGWTKGRKWGPPVLDLRTGSDKSLDHLQRRDWIAPNRDATRCSFHHIPHYSTNISAAWKVLARGEHQHGVPVLFQLSLHNDGPHCRMGWGSDNTNPAHAYGDTFAHAICLAALKAVGADLQPIPR